MKAAVLDNFGLVPRYKDFPNPVPGPDDILIRVKAVALENVDKAVAAGTHFASGQFLSQFPAVVGFDGIGELEDGSLVGFDGIGELEDGSLVGFGGMKPPFGAMAELAVVPKLYTVPIPAGIDPVIAAALPASALTSLFPLKYGARLEPGETILVNGATSVSGKLAVQVARLLGAGQIVGTGRNPESLRSVLAMGADAVIDLTQPDEALAATFKQEAGDGYDIILDFLWGHPTEMLIQTFIPEKIGQPGRRIRLVQIGEKAGEKISIPAGAIRTTGLEIMGAAAGLTGETIAEGAALVWEWIKENKLKMEIEIVPLRDIETAWQRDDFQGKRLVVVP